MQSYGTDKERDEFFKKVWLYAKNKNIINDLKLMSGEIIGSKALGYLLYDDGVFEILQNTDRDFFAEHYVAIFEAMEKAGIYDSYILLIEQVVGNGVGIQFSSPKPRHLIINIYNVESYQDRWITPSNLWLITPSNFGLLIPSPVSEYSLYQLKKILEILANAAGTYLEITFIEPILPGSVSISGVPTSVFKGDTGKLSATVTYTDGNSASTDDDSTIVTWSSSNDAVMTIDNSGNFNAVDSGTVTITALATSSDPAYGNNVSGDVSIDISPVVPSSITVSSFPDVVYSGDTGQLTASVTYTDDHVSNTTDNPSVVNWSSSDETILTIDANGNYTAISGGDVVVTALAVSNDPSYDDSVYQTISKSITAVVPSSVAIASSISILAVGDSGTLAATVTYNNGTSINSTDDPTVINWSSSDATKATIDSYGNYSALAQADSLTFTATSAESSSVTDSITVEITDFDYTKTKLVTPSNLWLITPSNLGLAIPLPPESEE